MDNCIVYGNSATNSGDNWDHYSPEISYSCTTPDPGSGTGNITNDPQFVGGGDYHLLSNSPCINTGTNAAWMIGGVDLDGSNRIQKVVVDMGAYESPYWGMYADVDGDGLTDVDETNTYGTSPTNINTDGDAHTDYEEVIADTDGANSNDYFCITAISNNSPYTVYFESSSNRFYTMNYCSNLLDAAWTNVPGAEAVQGEGGPDLLEDTNEPPKGPFYRMEVEL